MRRLQKFFSPRVATAFVLSAALHAVVGRAQEPLAPAAPLSRAAPATPTGRVTMTLAAAQRAQDLGLPSVAADIYRQLREAPGADRTALSLALATALLDAGSVAEAEKILAEQPEPRGAEWRLRTALAALQLGKREIAQAEWDAIKAPEVPDVDLPWYWFLTGALYDTAAVRDVTKANQYYLNAETHAKTELARARFQLAGEVVRLSLLSKPTEERMRQVRELYERYPGRSLGYDSAKSYAVMLVEFGKQKEGVEFLQQVLFTVPLQERETRDGLRFILGLIGDRGKNGAGRNALIQLLETGQNVQRQRQALQLLAEASREEPARQEFKAELSKLIAAKPPHPILESLYFFRAQFALVDKDYPRAEEDATSLGKQFPLSPLRVHALVLLTQSAWEQQRYRVAADNARKARVEMVAPGVAIELAPVSVAPGSPAKPPPVAISPRLRADLGVLEAEARFLAKDYRSAADAYAAVLLERPSELGARRIGELMFQRVLAEIKAGSGEAAKVLDELKRDPAFDLENRWQAEWSLARALQLQGTAGAKMAYARISDLLREPATEASAMKPELRAKMAWMHARLSFENGDPAETIRLVDEQLKVPVEIDPELRKEIASTLMLLKARSEFALGREPIALETLKRLRAEHAARDAAIQSYLIEAEYYAAQDKIDDARNRLISLTDNPAYKDSPYRSYALYRLALLSERLGRDANLEEANQRIEDLVKSPAAEADQTLLFAARMRQGDIFRKRNDFPAAERAYEALVNSYAQRPDVVLAQLALADCHSVQSSAADSSASNLHADKAQFIYEQLRDRVDAPRDVQVEAGYKLGELLVRRGRIEQAAKVWWSDVVGPFLVDETKPLEPDAKRPYWLARTLCELGDLQAKRGRIDEAKAAYLLVLEHRLPFGEAAKARLQQFGVPAAKPGQ